MATGAFFIFTESLTLTAVGAEVEQRVQMPSDGPFEVTHIDISAFDQNGAIIETAAVRDEIAVNIVDDNSGANFFNRAADIFLLRRASASSAFTSFRLRPRQQLRITAQVTNFVNGGVAVGSLPYKVNIAFYGRKIEGGV